MTFNGGKLYHIHTTVPGERQGSLVYTCNFTSRSAAAALQHGIKQLKVDGECSALHREDGQWVFYRRQDNYKGAAATLPLPAGRQSAQYDQGGKEHNYCWLRVDRDWTTGKGTRKSAPGPDTYATIDLAVKMELLPDPTGIDAPEWITCEWVGTKHQKNMDGVPYEHALIPHLEPFVPTLEFTTLQEFQEMVCKECFEGVVLIHPDGTRYKMRSDMSCPESVWEQHYKKKGGVTTIRPQVLTKDGLLTWKGEWVLQSSKVTTDQ